LRRNLFPKRFRPLRQRLRRDQIQVCVAQFELYTF
jgi:hypothetical protein